MKKIFLTFLFTLVLSGNSLFAFDITKQEFVPGGYETGEEVLNTDGESMFYSARDKKFLTCEEFKENGLKISPKLKKPDEIFSGGTPICDGQEMKITKNGETYTAVFDRKSGKFIRKKSLFDKIQNALTPSGPSLFDIEIGSNLSLYTEKQCLVDHNYENLGLDNFILTQYSNKDDTGPNWSEWIYTQSKLPVTEGCVEPKLTNEDFFNFNIKIFPESKDLYEIGALYKKVYKYSGSSIGTFSFMPIDGSKPQTVSITLNNTQCVERARELIEIIKTSQKKNGYKFSQEPRVIGGMSNSGYSYSGTKGMGSNKQEINIESKCSIKGEGYNLINNDTMSINEVNNFLISVRIFLNEYQSKQQYENEVNLIKENMRGNKNNNLNTDGL